MSFILYEYQLWLVLYKISNCLKQKNIPIPKEESNLSQHDKMPFNFRANNNNNGLSCEKKKRITITNTVILYKDCFLFKQVGFNFFNPCHQVNKY